MTHARTDAVVVFGGGADEEELPVHSLILRLASPVFDAMFASRKLEGQRQRVHVNVERISKDDFVEFYNLLLPLGSLGPELSERSMMTLYRLSDFFQVEPLKTECFARLDRAPATVSGLLLATDFGLGTVYERWAQAIVADYPGLVGVGQLEGRPDVRADLLERSKRRSVALQAETRKLRAELEKLQIAQEEYDARERMQVKMCDLRAQRRSGASKVTNRTSRCSSTSSATEFTNRRRC